MSRERVPLHRPLTPSDYWLEYERRYYGTVLLDDLKRTDSHLFNNLRSTDELHFVPRTRAEVRFRPRNEPVVPRGERMLSVRDMQEVLESTKSSIGLAATRDTSIPSILSTIAANTRTGPLWRDHTTRTVSGSSKTRPVVRHSPILAQAIMCEFVRRRRGLDSEGRARWIMAIEAYCRPLLSGESGTSAPPPKDMHTRPPPLDGEA